MNHTTKALAKHSRKELLGLPSELRQLIYEEYFAGWQVVVGSRYATRIVDCTKCYYDRGCCHYIQHAAVPDIWSLFVTCKLISKEARDVFYRKALFCFDGVTLHALSRKLSITNIPLPANEECCGPLNNNLYRIQNVRLDVQLYWKLDGCSLSKTLKAVLRDLPVLKELTLILDHNLARLHRNASSAVLSLSFLGALCQLENLRFFRLDSSGRHRKNYWEDLQRPEKCKYLLALGPILARHIQKPVSKQENANGHRLNRNGETTAQIQLIVTKQILQQYEEEFGPGIDKFGMLGKLRTEIEEMETSLANGN